MHTQQTRPNVDATFYRNPHRFVSAMVLVLLSVVGALALPACRTTEGLGRDVEHLGDNIADSADKHKP